MYHKNLYRFRSAILVALTFSLIFTHYAIWVKTTEPLPDHDGLFQYYYPVLNYLQATKTVGQKWCYLKNVFFDPEYAQGAALIAGLYGACGWVEQILKSPYLLHVFCILALSFLPFFWQGSFLNRLIIGLICGFFPLIQICLKQFSLFGPTVIFSFLALLFFRSWLALKKPLLLWGFIGCFWLAAAIKHLGLLLLINFVFAYCIWAILNRQLEIKVIIATLLSALGALPFYHFSGLQEYFYGSLAHNPFLSAHPLAGSVLFILATLCLLALPLLLAYYLNKTNKKRNLIPKFFRYGISLFLCLFSSSFIVITDLLNFPIIITGGYVFLLFLINKYHFYGTRGFVYLYTLFSLILMLGLYTTGVGHISYVIFQPLLLMLAQTITENRSFHLRIIFLSLTICSANFFPSFHTLDQLFGKYGRRIYILLFHSPHQNPLGWQNHGFGALRQEVINKLSEFSFPQRPLFLVENFGPFTSGQFAFRENVLYSFPPMMFLEWTSDGQLHPKLHQRYLQKKELLFTDLMANGDIPVLLYTDDTEFNEKDELPPTLEELLSEPDFKIENVNDDLYVQAFNQALINHLQEEQLLTENYRCFNLPKNKPFAHLCLDKRLEKLSAGQGRNYGLEYLQQIHQ